MQKVKCLSCGKRIFGIEMELDGEDYTGNKVSVLLENRHSMPQAWKEKQIVHTETAGMFLLLFFVSCFTMP